MRSEFMGEIITDMFGAIEGGRILESIAKSDPVCPHASEAIGRFWEAADDVDLFLSLVKSSSDLRWGMTWGLFARALDWDAPVHSDAIIDSYEIGDDERGSFAFVTRDAASTFIPCDRNGDPVRRVLVIKRGGFNAGAAREIGILTGEFAVLVNSSHTATDPRFDPYRADCCYGGRFRVYEQGGTAILENIDEAYR